MPKRKSEPWLHELNPFELDPTPANIGLVRRGLAKMDKVRLVWASVLDGWERSLGLAPSSGAGGDPFTDAPKVVRMPKGQPRAIPKEPTGDLNLVQGSFADVVYQILTNAGRPITYTELKERLLETPLGDKITQDDNPHYGAVQRLREKGYCVSHNGRISTPQNLRKFLDEVRAGREIDVVVPRHRNRWAEAVLAYLETRPNGATSREIAEHFATLPEFKQKAAHFSGSYIYGLLSKMARKFGTIERDLAGRYFLTGQAKNQEKEKTAGAEAPTVVH